eukprot:11473679-Ditylum_brightwellii.AAC.1
MLKAVTRRASLKKKPPLQTAIAATARVRHLASLATLATAKAASNATSEWQAMAELLTRVIIT